MAATTRAAATQATQAAAPATTWRQLPPAAPTPVVQRLPWGSPVARPWVGRQTPVEVTVSAGPAATAQLQRLVLAVVIVFVAAVPAWSAAWLAVDDPLEGEILPSGPTTLLTMLLATVLYLPFYLRLIWCAVRDMPPRGGPWMLAVMAAVIGGALPLLGAGWLPSLAPLGLAVLIVLRPPWAAVAFGIVAVAPASLMVLLEGHPHVGLWAAFAVTKSLAVFVLLRMLAAVRRLEAARAALASQAVLRERVRIDDELRRTVGADLAAVAASGERAGALFEQDRELAGRQLRDLVEASRRTLARARRMVAGYRRPSLHTEINTAETVLQAGGIDARIEAPAGDLPPDIAVKVRQAVRAVTADLLRAGSPRRCVVTIEPGGREGRVEMCIAPASSEEVTAR